MRHRQLRRQVDDERNQYSARSCRMILARQTELLTLCPMLMRNINSRLFVYFWVLVVWRRGPQPDILPPEL